VISMAHQLGISEYIPPYPSIVIGSTAVHPLEMAGAYAAVADGGVYHKPSFINYVTDRTGQVIYRGLDPGRRVFSARIAAEADIALQAVVQNGTGTAAGLFNRPVAGKTGTTENNVDAWFNGFTPQIETTVWMGNTSREVPIYINGAAVFGANYPAETWHTFDNAVLANSPVLPLPAPPLYLPPAHYITSPSLVADDVLDHNAPPRPPPPKAAPPRPRAPAPRPPVVRRTKKA